MRTITPTVGAVKDGMPAAAAGIKPGDVITSVDGWTVEGFEDVQRIVGINAGRPLRFDIDRGGEKLSIEVTPEVHEQPDTFGGTFRRGLIGISPVDHGRLPGGQIRRPHRGACGSACARPTPTSPIPCRASRDIVTQRQAADQMGGPILMAQVTAKVAEGGIEPMLRWIAFISANIGFLNLLPIPVLDGGHLVYYAIEGVLRRPMSRRMQEIGFQIGVALVLMLMVYVNLNDLLRVWRGWTGAG